MEKRINFRSFLVIAPCVFLAVITVYIAQLSRPAGIALGCVYVCSLAAVAAIAIYKYITKRCALRYPITFCIAFLLCTLAFVFGITYADARSGGAKATENRVFSGRVCAVDMSTGEYRFFVEDLSLDGKSVDGDALVTVRADQNNNAQFIKTGDRIAFYSRVSYVPLVSKGKVNGWSYRTDVRYTAAVSGGDIEVTFGDPTLSERFTDGLREIYTKNMGEKYGNIAFTMFSGDKHMLDREVYLYFTGAGLGHLLAVSGLHVGFMALLLEFLLKRLDKRARYPIIMTALVVYAAFVGFSPSVVRAVIMCGISGFAFYVGGRKDLLSSLLCAFSFILAFRPFYLFESGFLMSFGSVFGIALFSNSMLHALTRMHIDQKIANVLALCFSVTIGFLPAQIYFAHRVGWLFPILNMFLAPFLFAIYISTVALLPVAAIPGCGAVLTVPKIMFIGLDGAAQGFASIPFAFTYLSSSAGIFVCYPIMFCASDFFMKDKGGRIITLYSAVVCILIALLCAL